METRERWGRRGATVAAVTVVTSVLAACSGQSTPPGATGTSTVGPSAAAYGTGPCAPVEGAGAPVLDFPDAFADCLDPGKTYTATVQTTEGTVALQLDTLRTPIAANNFVNLARSGYFDGTQLFRTEAQTGIIQGGSPHTQDNRDPGPGYTIPDEGLPFSSADYAPGVIAMANSGPDSGGGQFFFLSRAAGSYLGDPSAIGASAGSYVVFGHTTEGLDVLQAISDLESAPGSSTPRRPVTIESVTISES